MKKLIALLVILFAVLQLTAQDACTVKIIATRNNTTPIGYSFKTDPQTTGAKYLWSFGDNGVSDNATPTHLFAKAASFTINVKVTGPDGKICTGVLTQTFEATVETPCTVKIVATKNNTTPIGYSFKIDPQAVGAKYAWTFGDGGTSDNATPVHVYAKAGTYPVVVKVTGADGKICTGELKETFEATAETPCTVKIVFTKNSTTPIGYSFKTDPQTTGAKYSWSFGDGGTSDNATPTHIFPKTASYAIYVKMIGPDGKICTGELKESFEATAETPCTVKIIATKNATTPIGYSFKTDTQTVGAKYLWSFGDGGASDNATPTHSFTKAASYTINVKVTGTDGKICTGALTQAFDATVETPCTVKIVATKNSTTPIGYSFKLDPQATGAKYAWTFGDGGTSDNATPVHVYAKAGTYPVVVKVTGADGKICTGELKQSFEATAETPCTVKIVVTKNNTTPIGYSFKTDPQTTGAKYAWVFGDGWTSDNATPLHVFATSATFSVVVKVTGTDGKVCTGELKMAFSAGTTADLPTCKGAISLLLYDPTNNLCNGSATVKLLDEAGKEVPNVKYLWHENKTGSSISGLCPGKQYSVQAVVENVCQKTSTFTLLSKPVWKTSSINGMDNYTVLAPVEGVAYEWNFGNGVVMTGSSVNYNFPKDGVYDVQLKALSTNGSSASTQQVVIMKNLAVTEVLPQMQLDLYPNPVKEILRIDFKNSPEGLLTFQIKNISGQVVFVTQLTNDGSSHADLNIQNLKAGIYVLRVYNDKKLLADKKFIKAD